MELTFVIDNITKRVVVDKKNDIYHFVIDDREYAVEAMPLANGSLSFFIGNRTYVALISKDETGTNIGLDGKTYFQGGLEDDGTPGGGGHGDGHGDGSVESPMPGNIIAVNVKEGDEVEAGDAVVVIESMKMQNEITAPVSGKVSKVGCAVGDQVAFGAMLVEIEPPEELSGTKSKKKARRPNREPRLSFI
jgi:biotin carboxyl carrier protein